MMNDRSIKHMLTMSYWFARDAVLANPHKLNVISVERTEVVNVELCKNHLHLKVDDIDDRSIKQFGSVLKNIGTIFPEKEHIIKAIEFSRLHKVHIIHCAAGVSRSTGIHYSILRSQGLTKKEATKQVLKVNPHALPNKRIVRLTDEMINNGDIYKMSHVSQHPKL